MKGPAKVFLLLLMHLPIAGMVHAQEGGYHFLHFTHAGGELPHDGIRVIFEDSRHDIWIGTQKGLCRYDGERFSVFDKVHFGVESDHVSALAEAPDGNIWVGTDDGIVVYDVQSGGFSPLAPQIIHSRVYAMERDASGTIWIGISGEGVYRSDGPSQVHRVRGVDVSNVYRIAFCKDGSPLLVSYMEDIFVLKGAGTPSQSLRSVVPQYFTHDDVEGVATVYGDEGTILYVASKSRGLSRVDMKTGKVEPLLPLSGGCRPVSLLRDGNSLWLSTTEGLVRYDILTGNNYRLGPDPDDQFSLNDNFIRGVLVGSGGDLWVGTDNAGVNLCSTGSSRFVNYYRLGTGDNLSSCFVKGIARTSDGRVWVATQRGGLLQFPEDGAPSSVRAVNSSSLPSNITAICADGEILWLGTQQGAVRFNPETSESKVYNRFEPLSENTDNRVVSLYRGSDGTIWLGAANGVMKLDGTKDEFVSVPDLTGIAVEDFKEDRSGRLWMATYSKGVCLYDPVGGKVLSFFGRLYGNGTIGDMTSSICIDGSGDVWTIGFNSGIYRYDESRGEFVNINRSNTPRLPTDLFLTAIADSRGCLWMSSDAGLVQFVPGTRAVRTYTETDGILGKFQKGGIALPDGSLLFAASDGVVRFNPADFEIPTVPEDTLGNQWYTGVTVAVLLAVLFVAGVAVLIGWRIQARRQKRIQKEREIAMEERLYKEKMSFFSGIIHEIKTPLTLIRTPLKHLLASGSPTPEQRESLGVISNSTEYLERLVKEMLDFIRAEEHGYVLELSNQDLCERIDFAVMNFKETAKARGLRLTFSPQERPVVTAVDSKAFEKILNNLVDNAIRYAASFVNISLKREGNEVKVLVDNDGPAIPRSRREKIFGAFVTFQGEHMPYSNSFGIGLSFARHLAEMHGGTLVLSDREDITEFVLSLPVKLVAAEAEDIDWDAEVNSSSLPLVLVVEDNRDMLSFIRSKLKPHYRCLTATSAERALELMDRYQVDLLVTDIGLKGMSGVELCRKVSRSDNLSHIPIVVLSAITSDDVRIKCMQYGVSAYIEKPFSVEYLLACVKGQLAKREEIRANAGSAVPAGSDRLHLADRDAKFKGALDKLILDNISNPDFSNKEMEAALAISRSSLNRRVTELLGTTPNNYLRSKRLEVAERMLRETPSAMVSEVCYAVGFKNPSYFAHCFAAVYGMSPTEYKETIHK